MTGALSPTHWVIIIVVVVMLFGAKRLPDAARGLGRSLRILKAETTALSSESSPSSDGADETPATAGAGTPQAADAPPPAGTPPVRSAQPVDESAA